MKPKNQTKKPKLPLGAAIENPGNTILNKTDGWRTFRPIWDSKKCIQCMQCWQFCPDSAIPQKNGKRQETNFDFCKGCGICAEVCPVKAIKMVKEEK